MSLGTKSGLEARRSPIPNRLVHPGWIWTLYLLPALLAAAYIGRHGVNAPVEDEWSLPYMFYYAKANLQSFITFLWPPHNEHRIVLPKLIWELIAFPTHWNLELNMFLTLGLMSVTFVWMARTALRDQPGNYKGLHAAIIASALLLFSPVHWDTWLFAWQFTFALTLCLSIAAILVAGSTGLRPWIAAALCFLATFSTLQGLITWIVILPAVFFAIPERSKRARACVFILVCFGLTMALYYVDYHPVVPIKPDPTLIFKRPVGVIWFWLALMGAPLAQSFSHVESMAEALGAASVITFVIALYGSVRSGIFRDTLVWTLIGIYGIAADAMIAVGRAGWGAWVAATMSRYMISTCLIQVATLILLARVATRVRAWQPFVWVTAVAIAGFELASYPVASEKGHELHQSRMIGAQSLEVMPYVDPATDQAEKGLLFPLYPVPVPGLSVRPPAELLYKAGLRWIEHNARFEENPPFCGCVDTPSLQSGKPFAIGKSQPLAVSGWTFYPEKTVLPKVVFFSTDDRRLFISGAAVGDSLPRPDVAGFMKNPALVHAGWSTEIPAAFLPTGEFELKAWIYDRNHSRFLRLRACVGPTRIRREP